MPWRVCFAGYAPFATDAAGGHGGVCKRRCQLPQTQRGAALFCRVAENIKQGAPFVFDVSSPYKLQNALGNNVFFVDDDDATLLWTNAFRSGKATLSLTLFERQSNGSYLRFDEKHIQYAHSVEFLTQCLKEAGFVVAEITSDYGEKLSAESLRITFLTRKEV